MARKVPEFIGEVQPDGKVRFTMEFLRFLNDITDGKDPNQPSLGTINSGVARARALVDGVIDGTQVLATVNTAGAGNLPAALASQASSLNNVAAGTGFTVVLDRTSVTNNAPLSGAGTATTQSVTATIYGGTGPFTQAWTYLSGQTGFAATAGTALTTAFTRTQADGEVSNAVWRITVTDATLATATADLPVNAYSTPLA